MAAWLCTFSTTRDYTTLHGAQWLTKENDNRFNERFLFPHTLLCARTYACVCVYVSAYSVMTQLFHVYCKKAKAVIWQSLKKLSILYNNEIVWTAQRLSSGHERKVIKKLSKNITVRAKINEHLQETVGISSCSAKVLILTQGDNK